MKTALLWIAGMLAWYLIGFITMSISNAFDGGWDDRTQWLKMRRFCYSFAALGPICTIITISTWIFMGLQNLVKRMHEYRRWNSFRAKFTEFADWMIAGFRKPPVPPTVKDSDSSDFLTASP